MKILFITNELGYRGTPRFLAYCATIAHQANNKTLVWGLDTGGAAQDKCHEAGIDIIIGEARLDSAIRFHPDLVHIHRGGGYSDRDIRILRALKESCGCKVLETNVFGILDLTPSLPIDLHSHISHWDLWRWRRWLWPFHKPGIALPYCIDTALFKPTPSSFRKDRGIPEDAFLIGRLGKTDWQSLGNALVTTMGKNRNIWFATVGDYSDAAGKHPIFQQFADRIVAIPRLNGPEELSRFYSACDVTVNFSPIGESFGYGIAESMSCGTPVVVLSKPRNDNAQVELSAPEHGGFPVDGAANAAAVILEIESDRSRLVAARAKCRESIRQRYDTTVFAPMLLKAYELLLATSTNGRKLETLLVDNGFYADFPEKEVMRQLSSVRGGLPSLWERIKMRLAYSFPNALRNHLRTRFS